MGSEHRLHIWVQLLSIDVGSLNEAEVRISRGQNRAQRPAIMLVLGEVLHQCPNVFLPGQVDNVHAHDEVHESHAH